ncbi:maleylpyruvate isomerase family mycothiol-dependent enzyme [Kribbella sp. NPDC051770]|uniref:maleylpyruvate isomerase family mycothiol-dependent enzyme n=1 Tax=Kribbella sp. NPDC051770 TaxID=3155413 RepID=UPI00341C2D87
MLDLLGELDRTAAELAEVFDSVDPSAAVPSCPGWTVADLALHIGSGQRWSASVLLSGREQQRPEVLLTTISWSDWYAGTTAALLAAIRAVDPAEPCWNFAPVDQRAAFWPRRRLHETTIHLVDAHQAAGRTTDGISPVVAADGVDEVFEVFMPRVLARGFAPAVTRRMGVLAVDTGDAWTLTPGEGAPGVERGRADGDIVLSGRAEDLLLALWKRIPPAQLTIEGDQQVAADFFAQRVTS